MKIIINGIIKKEQLSEEILKIIKDVYYYDKTDEIKTKISDFLNILTDDLFFYIEYPYVDKVYRDSYYFYFSSKHKDYFRDCIRISIFTKQIRLNYFRDNKFFKTLQDSYLGYLIIRPTFPNIIGRSMISPKALKNNNFLTCLTINETLINGVKLKVAGFPHSSQDGESISCAETTIWSLMEYYGSKYNEYKTILPSDIIGKLNDLSAERLIPTHGLTNTQISYALKQFGFSPRLYSLSAYEKSPDEFKRIVYYYIESGIPIIASIQNDKIGHAMIFCGHEQYDLINIKKENPLILKRDGKNDLNIYDSADFKKMITTIDDNMMSYKLVEFDNPTCNYNDDDFKKCEIKGLIVPLYKKIYIEAPIARDMVFAILKDKDFGINEDEIIMRLFLTSSRSYKYKMASNLSLNNDLKELIILSSMPKFIWVAELSNFDLFKEKKASGLIVIDATAGKNENKLNSTILIFYKNRQILFDNNKPAVYNIPLDNFNIFTNNLRGV